MLKIGLEGGSGWSPAGEVGGVAVFVAASMVLEGCARVPGPSQRARHCRSGHGVAGQAMAVSSAAMRMTL